MGLKFFAKVRRDVLINCQLQVKFISYNVNFYLKTIFKLRNSNFVKKNLNNLLIENSQFFWMF